MLEFSVSVLSSIISKSIMVSFGFLFVCWFLTTMGFPVVFASVQASALVIGDSILDSLFSALVFCGMSHTGFSILI